MKKFLIVAHNIRFVVQFVMNDISLLQGMGYEVHCAVNYQEDHVINDAVDILEKAGVVIHQIDCARSPLRVIKNTKALHQLVKLIRREKFEGLHCHTPIGGVLGRVGGKLGGVNRIFYTAHGFHFFKGSSIKSWLLYFPAEWLCSFMTEVIITVNKEDYECARKRLHAKKVEYIPGVGLDVDRISGIKLDVAKKRESVGIPDSMIWLLAVGEMTKNKNHLSLIQAIADIPNVYLTIAGCGKENANLEQQISKLKLNDRVKLLGFRNDVTELLNAADIFVLPSYREGLSVALMEAMSCCKPVACSRIRGNIDLIDDQGGVLFDPHSVSDMHNAILKIADSPWELMGKHNWDKIQKFTVQETTKIMRKIYSGAADVDSEG